jgi:hypothetical protein
MQDWNPSFIVKLGAIPQPILAAIALMTEVKRHDQEEREPEANCVDIENLVRETTRPLRRQSSSEK